MAKRSAEPEPAPSEIFEQTLASLKRVQTFQVESLPRSKELGDAFAFDDAVAPARRLIVLFQQVPERHLSELPDPQLGVVKQQSDSLYKLFNDILEFDPSSIDNAASQRNSLADRLRSSYESYFNALHPIISYLASRMRDFAALETEARAAAQSARDEASAVSEQLKEHEETAQRILATIQKIAAEQGVSQQAVYFKNEADEHDKKAEEWRTYTLIATAVLVILAFASLYVHHLPGLVTQSVYQSAQVAISKIIIFAILGFILVLCAKNFLAHRHNAIVNRHRQNALLTFRALVEAAGDERQDIVLTHASSCIFAPQETGYTKGGSNSQSSQSAMALMPYALRETSGP